MPAQDEAKIYWVHSGVWEVRIGYSKILDLAWDDCLVLIEKTSLQFDDHQMWCSVMQNSSYTELPVKTIFGDDDLIAVNSFLQYLSWRSNFLHKRLLRLCLNDSYQEVKYSLEWLAKTPAKVRAAVSAIYFITHTSKVSRSHALSIIKALKAGEYIEIKEGHLVRLLKALPERY